MRQGVPPSAGHGSGDGYGGAGAAGRGAAHRGAADRDSAYRDNRGALPAPARAAGAAVAVVLLAAEIAWTVRDLRNSGPRNTLWHGLSLQPDRFLADFFGTSLIDVVLAVVLAGAAIASRRPTAGPVYTAVGLLLIADRLPGLWIYTADWMRDGPLHDRGLATSIAFVAGGAVLGALGLTGRRRSGAADGEAVVYGTAVAPGAGGPGSAIGGPGAGGTGGAAVATDIGDNTAGAVRRPNGQAAVLGGVLLLVFTLQAVAWQLYDVQEYNDASYPPHLYRHLLSGTRTITSLLGMPTAYAGWATAALALIGAVAGLTRSPLARPLGLAVGLQIMAGAVLSLDVWHTEGVLFTSGEAPTRVLVEQSFEVGEVVLGLAVMLVFALAPRGRAGVGPPPPAS